MCDGVAIDGGGMVCNMCVCGYLCGCVCGCVGVWVCM